MSIKPYTIILGASGSVGLQAIDVLKRSNRGIEIVGLANKNSQEQLEKIKDEFKTQEAQIFLYTESKKTDSLESYIQKIVKMFGSENLSGLNAISGFDGLRASVILAKYHIQTLLANKESVVAGGDVYLEYAREQKVDIIPVDSEHSAIFSLINAHKGDVKRVIITASGGPFRNKKGNLKDINLQEAICHPTWKMGEKISIDSATLANKVAEVVEAKYLFNLKSEQISVVINPESIVHSLIEMKNGSYFAELSCPDMHLPLSKAYGLYDESFIEPLDFSKLNINFFAPDTERFKFLTLKDIVLLNQRNSIIFNAANEEAVKAFRDEKILFTDIYELTNLVLKNSDTISKNLNPKTFDEIYDIDKRTREYTHQVLEEFFQL